MEQVKEKGIFKRFIEWLNKTDEPEIDDSGYINEKAFEEEDAKIIDTLKKQAKKIDNMGNEIFIDKEKQRRTKTIKEIKAKIETPSINEQEAKKENRDEYSQEK